MIFVAGVDEFGRGPLAVPIYKFPDPSFDNWFWKA